MNQFKKCAGKCKKILSADDFYKCRSSWDGRDTRCKECAKNWQKDTHEFRFNGLAALDRLLNLHHNGNSFGDQT
jgi:hypothetical protein